MVEELVKQNVDTTIIEKRPLGSDYDFFEKTRFVQWDLSQELPSSVEIPNVDVVFHLAGDLNIFKAINEPENVFRNNVLATLNLLEAIRKRGIECAIIFISTDRVYGKPSKDIVDETESPTPLESYAASKIACEALCRAYYATYSIPFVILRAANTYGPRQSTKLFIPTVIQQIITNRNIRVGSLDVYRNFVYIKDLIAAFMKASTLESAKNKIFNVSESGVKIEDVVSLLSRLGEKYLDKKFKIKTDPNLFRPSGTEIRRFSLDCARARRILNWKPKFPLKRGLDTTFRWYLDNYRTKG